MRRLTVTTLSAVIRCVFLIWAICAALLAAVCGLASLTAAAPPASGSDQPISMTDEYSQPTDDESTPPTAFGDPDFIWDLSGYAASSDEDIMRFADRMMDGSLVVTDQLEEIEYAPDTFDWGVSHTSSPNTFQLYLHGLTPLQALTRAYCITGQTEYLDEGLRMLDSWCAYEESEAGESNVMLWHDHGAAIRAESLLCFAANIAGTEIDTPELSERLHSLLLEHAGFLATEEHYTKNHNHGIIQDKALLRVAHYVDTEETPEWMSIAKERLSGQEEFAFNSEMVHVENSPGYCAGVIDIFHSISDFLISIDDPFGEELYSDLYAAADFLAWVTMPNGIVAQIGDTTGTRELVSSTGKYLPFGNERLSFASTRGCIDNMTAEQKHQTVKYYPDAGYYFIREGWDSEKSTDTTWKMLKAGYSTRTHKHADDLSFMLYSRGYEIFTDNGWYNYMVGNELHDYLVSSSAHNTVTVDEKSYSPTPENSHLTGLLLSESTELLDRVLAFNDMYSGVGIDRHFYSSGDMIVLHDNISADQTHLYSQLFHVGEYLTIVSSTPEETVLAIADTGYKVRIRQYTDVSQDIFSERSDAKPLYGRISRMLNDIDSISTIKYSTTASDADFITVITIESPWGFVRLKDGSRIHQSRISFDSESASIRYGKNRIQLEERERFFAEAQITLDGTQLSAAAAEYAGCEYSWQLLSAATGERLTQTDYTKSSACSLDLSEYREDVLLRLIVRSADRQQEKHSIVGAAVRTDGSFSLDCGEKYPYLNLAYNGHAISRVEGNTYRYTIDCSYSLGSTVQWYIYRGGSYYSKIATHDDHTLEYTFTEPGEYTIIYYLTTVTGNNEYWNFECVTIE